MNHRKPAVILFVCIVSFLSVLDTAASEISPNALTPGKVLKNIKDSDNIYLEKVGRYFLEEDDCSICWEIEVSKEDKKIMLSSRQPLGIKCTSPFVKQIPLHRKIFTEIFKDWEKDRFNIIFIGPFSRLEPAHTWNQRVALASAKSSDWIDWRENYPNHSSGKYINQIFIDLVNHADACKELTGLLEEFGLKIELKSVEKVFEQKAKNLPFHQELKSRGLKDDQRLIYDAGMINFSVSPIN